MTKQIGIIGYGLRSEMLINTFRSLEADIAVAAVADPRYAEIAPSVADHSFFANTRWGDQAEALLTDDRLDGVLIGTRCSLHTPLTCQVLAAGLPLFLEKPVCINRAHWPGALPRRPGRRPHR